MSSIVRRPNGHRWITYKFAGKRHTLRLGVTSDDIAEEVKRRLDRLIEFRRHGLPADPETHAWLIRLDDRLHRSLITAGLTSARGPTSLGELLALHEKHLIIRNCKPSTLINARVLYENLRTYFSASRSFRTLTRAECDGFRHWLLTIGGKRQTALAKATATNRCHRAKAIFKYAIENKWLEENPFQHSAKRLEVNRDRDRYITMEVFHRLINSTTDRELRLLLAMVRIAGVRCPSEIRPLTWQSVQWDDGVIVVVSPKTEGYEDQERREVPILPAMRPFLDDAWEHAPEGAVLMFPRHQGTGAAITNRLESLLRKIGEPLIPKPMVNMRASAERDAFAMGHAPDQVAAWFGHSPTTALKHYSRVVKERQARAASKALRSPSEDNASEAEPEAP